ncbi:hypothetical protein GCM10010339_38780 [Streptomyces alanosinicus]|uniref:Uncharacterized protein n=1 Tax=Streptomyces alanosinicus TaxID=68171 RepID=A0A918YJ91_9ACTN|nr:hypothetical protein GCM10010339_38780 [Streptomyces alanosinicus]
MALYRLDSVIRAREPATLLCTTIRMVRSSKDGPPVVILGDQALTRTPLPCADGVAAPAACAVLSGTAARAMPVTAPSTDSKDPRRGRRPASVLPFAGNILDLSTLVVGRSQAKSPGMTD